MVKVADNFKEQRQKMDCTSMELWCLLFSLGTLCTFWSYEQTYITVSTFICGEKGQEHMKKTSLLDRIELSFF